MIMPRGSDQLLLPVSPIFIVSLPAACAERLRSNPDASAPPATRVDDFRNSRREG